MIAHNANEVPFFESAKPLFHRISGRDDFPSVLLSNGEDPVIEPFIFDRFSNRNPMHPSGSVKKKDFPIRLVAAEKNHPMSLGIDRFSNFWIFTMDDAGKVGFSRKARVFEAIDRQVLKRFFCVVDELRGGEGKIIGKSEIAEGPFSIFAHEIKGS